MTLIVTSPQGRGSAPSGVCWSETYSSNVILDGVSNLIASSNYGFGQGTCVQPLYAQSNGTFYWEVGWADVDPSLIGGIGICTVPPSPTPGPGSGTMINSFYQGLASNGFGGAILRPDGSIWVNGAQQIPSSPPPPTFFSPQGAGNTVGIAATIAPDGSGGINFFGVGGSFSGFVNTSTFTWSPGSFPSIIPCVVFGNASILSLNVVTALFSQINQGAFLINNFPGFIADIPAVTTFGWPASF